jgi:hypothetical protein
VKGKVGVGGQLGDCEDIGMSTLVLGRFPRTLQCGHVELASLGLVDISLVVLDGGLIVVVRSLHCVVIWTS